MRDSRLDGLLLPDVLRQVDHANLRMRRGDFVEDRRRAVGAPVVHDDDLEVFVRLPEDGSDAPPDQALFVLHGDDARHRGPGVHDPRIGRIEGRIFVVPVRGEERGERDERHEDPIDPQERVDGYVEEELPGEDDEEGDDDERLHEAGADHAGFSFDSRYSRSTARAPSRRWHTSGAAALTYRMSFGRHVPPIPSRASMTSTFHLLFIAVRSSSKSSPFASQTSFSSSA